MTDLIMRGLTEGTVHEAWESLGNTKPNAEEKYNRFGASYMHAEVPRQVLG
jgi:hypothetical protein